MLKRILIGTGVLLATVVLGGYILFLGNAAPAVAAVSTSAAADPDKPFIVKLHSQWCVVCLSTKDIWHEIAAEYAGRANLVVFDFTDMDSTNASEAEARRLGLGEFFAEYAGMSGAIAVIDGGSRETRALIGGKHPTDVYRAEIDASLAAAR